MQWLPVAFACTLPVSVFSPLFSLDDDLLLTFFSSLLLPAGSTDTALAVSYKSAQNATQCCEMTQYFPVGLCCFLLQSLDKSEAARTCSFLVCLP